MARLGETNSGQLIRNGACAWEGIRDGLNDWIRQGRYRREHVRDRAERQLDGQRIGDRTYGVGYWCHNFGYRVNDLGHRLYDCFTRVCQCSISNGNNGIDDPGNGAVRKAACERQTAHGGVHRLNDVRYDWGDHGYGRGRRRQGRNGSHDWS